MRELRGGLSLLATLALALEWSGQAEAIGSSEAPDRALELSQRAQAVREAWRDRLGETAAVLEEIMSAQFGNFPNSGHFRNY